MNVVPLHAAPIRPMRPVPAVLATLLASTYAIHAAYVGTNGIFDRDVTEIASFGTLALWGLLLAGLWRGSWLAQVLVVVVGCLTVIGTYPDLGDVNGWQDAVSPTLRLAVGVALILLLGIPASSRTFYARRPR